MEEIPPDLIINWDRTGLHVVPGSSWTMALKGSKCIEIKGLNDKSSSLLQLYSVLPC